MTVVVVVITTTTVAYREVKSEFVMVDEFSVGFGFLYGKDKPSKTIRELELASGQR